MDLNILEEIYWEEVKLVEVFVNIFYNDFY